MKVDLRHRARPDDGPPAGADDAAAPGDRAGAPVLGVAAAAGLAWLVWSTARFVGSVGTAAVAVGLVALAVLLAVLVALVRRIDRPRTVGWPTALFVLVWGGVVCIWPVRPVFFGALGLARPWFTGPTGRAFAPAVVAPVVEETAKVLAVLAVGLIGVAATAGAGTGFCARLRAAVGAPRRAMVLGSLSGVGFQVVENLRYALDAAREAAPAGQAHVALVVSVQRGVGGIALSHWMFSACTGLAVGLLLAPGARRGDRRRWAAAALVAAALVAHGGNDAVLGLAHVVGYPLAGRIQTVFAAAAFAGFVAVVLGAARGFRRLDLDPPLAADLLRTRADDDAAVWALVAGVLSVATAAAAPLVGLIWLVGVVGIVLGLVAVRRPAVAYRGLVAVVTGGCGLILGFGVSVLALPPLLAFLRF